jgi:hypothetical protein
MRLILGFIAALVLLYVLKRFPISRWILAALLCIPLVFIIAPHELRHWYDRQLPASRNQDPTTEPLQPKQSQPL